MDTRFRDRADAGRRLAARLGPLRAENPVVIGLARGGVVVAAEVAQAVGSPLDVLVVRKIEAPVDPDSEEASQFEVKRHLDTDLRDRTIILIDDGLATGVTAMAAAEYVRAQGLRRVILASPICSPSAAARLRRHTDEVICLCSPEGFRSIDQWYENFDPTTEEEVLALTGAPVLSRYLA